jgi:7,8-dihydropterin-6-yl-methyl-4-(beta-D-ribofuranosyl)aminobenzene 5'-phosphate synthase
MIGLVLCVLALSVHGVTGSEAVTITVVYNNVSGSKGLKTAWGQSCLIRGFDKTILFDTGGNGSTLLSNMRKMGIDPKEVDAVVLSHIHRDHTGGIWDLLETRSNLEVYCLSSFPVSFRYRLEGSGVRPVEVSAPVKVCDGVYSTGEQEGRVNEQALVLKVKEGSIVLTGCSHPGVVEMVRRAKEVCPGEVYLLMGGFHLEWARKKRVASIIRELKLLGVRKIAPNHCTGSRATEMFKEAWGDDFVESGCGYVLKVDT